MGGAYGGKSGGGSAVSRPTATLLLTADSGRDVVTSCGVTAETANVLVVSATDTAAEVVREWRSGGALPAGFGLVTFAEFDRSASATDRPSRRSVPGPDVTLTTMSDPGNLRRLGTAVTLYLDEWDDSDRETVVYVDAIDPFVEANDLESAFQFLHLLVRSVAQVDAELVVCTDPSATDDRTVNTLRSLFDEVVDADAEPSPLHTDEILDMLGNPRRRFVIRSLPDASAVGLDEMAARLARWENDTEDPTEAERTRAYTALASVHVPRLAEAGVVVFDRANERIRLSDAARQSDRLDRYLD